MVWISLLVSQGGYWVAAVSLQLVVVRLTHGNAFEQGQLLFFTFSPNLFMSPFAGVMADRYDRRRLIIASQLGITVMASALAVALALGVTRLELLYVLAFGLGSCVSFAQPVIQAIAADAVPRVSLPSAIALLSMSINISRVVGPALAVPIVLLGGAVTAFAVYAGAAIVATMLLSRVRLPPTTRPALRGGWAANLRDGFRHAAARPPILLYLAMVGVGSLFSAGYNTLVPVISVSILHQGSNGFFALVVAIGVGAALCAVATGFVIGHLRPAAAALEMAVLGAVVILLGHAHEYLWLLLLSAAYGAIFFALMTTLATAIQYLVDDHNRGRVMGLYVLCWGGLAPVGNLLIGFTASRLGTAGALDLFGAVTLIYAAAVLILRPRALTALAAFLKRAPA